MPKVRILVVLLTGAAALSFIGLRGAHTQSPLVLRRVTNTTEEGINLNPAISGDGKILAFESTEDIASVGGTDHFRAIRADIAFDPATFFQMGGTRAVTPAISQDGSRIALASKDDPLGTNLDGNSEIFLLDGSRLTQVTNTSPGDLGNRVTNGNFQPSISDDGRFIAFASNRDLAGQNSDGNLEIFVYDALNSSFNQLTNTSGAVGSSDAKISGNGASIAFIRDNGTTPSAKRDLMEQARVTPSTAVLLVGNVQSLAMTYGRAISDDGTRVVYAAETATNTTQVFLFDGRGGSTARQVTQLGARVTEVPLHPTISGDGTRIAFAARRSVPGAPANSDGGVELYVLDIPSSQLSKITNAPSAATADVVSSLSDDGSVVAFNFPRILSGSLTNSELANDSEIYVTVPPPRPPSGPLTVLNGASFGKEPSTTKAVAPDSIAVATGGSLANSTQQSQKLPNGTFPTNVGGTTVTVNGRAAQIFFVSPSQVNFLVPPQTEIGTADMVITNSENFTSRGAVPTLRAAPGVFTVPGDGTGDGVILNASTLQSGPFDPSDGKLSLIIFATGARLGAQTQVVIAGRGLAAESVLAEPDMPGLDEVRVKIPADLRGAGILDLFVQSDGRASNPVSVTFTGDPTRDVLINEALADPPDGIAGDANQDGVRDSADDEFIELVNTTTHDIDISGYQLLSRSSSATTDTLRHTFAAGTILPACVAVVVFGGGAFDPNNPAFGGTPVVAATSGGLSLTNGGGAITLRDSATAIITSLNWGGSTGLNGDANQSMTRSPDTTGNFALHQAAAGNGGRSFSPGTRLNGAAFAQCNSFVRIDVKPLAASIEAGARQQFTARAINASGNEVSGVIFSWRSSNTSVATIDSQGLATGIRGGSTEITAAGHGTTSAPATLSVNAAAPTPTPLVVISQVYGGGGNSGARFKNDFIEVFNRGTTSVNLAGWSVQQTSASGASWVATPLCPIGPCTLAAGQYFLVQEAGGANGSDLPALDATGTINLSATDGKVALLSNTTALSGTDCSAWKTNSVDFVGYGGATCFEGAGATPAPSNTRSVFRNNNGCTDTDNNGADFTAANAGPRNAGSPLNVCSSAPPTPTPSVSPTPTPTATPTPTPTVAASIVISEFRTHGPTGANDEFIELYNNSDAVIDVGGWKIKGSNNAGSVTTRVTINAGTSIPARGHFLATNSSASGYSGSVAGNQTYTSGITDDGGIAITDAADAIADQVGLSNGSAFKEGAVLTPLTTNTNQSYERKPGGGLGSTQDTNDNVNDFRLLGPSDPQNLSSRPTPVPSPTPIPTPTPNLPTLSINDVTVAEGNTGTTTATFTVSLNVASAQTVTVDYATASGAAIAGSDYQATNGTLTFSPGETSKPITVDVIGDTLVEPDEGFFVNITGPANALVSHSPGVGTIQNDDTALVVISQLYGGGGNSGATFKNDFIEVFNRGTTTVDLAGWSVQYTSATGTGTWASTPLCASTCLLVPGRYFLVQEDQGAGGTTNLPPPDATGTIAMTTGAGKVALVSATAALAGGCPSSTSILDLVGYGSTASCFEGSAPTGAPGNTTSVFRRSGGCTDTNDNAADSFVSAPFPRNSGSPVNNCAGGTPPNLTINDVTVVEGSSGTTTATFTVSLSAAASTDVTFDIATQNNSATTANSDYVSKSLTSQIIPAGQTTYTFSVIVNGDVAIEPDETFFVNVANVSGASTTDGQGLGTIQNDDFPTLSINDVSLNEGDGSTSTFHFTVSLSAPALAGGVTFEVATQDGTATVADNDYLAHSLTAQTIPAGQQTYGFDVTVNGDLSIEPNEVFFVNVTNVSGATIVDGQGAGTIENDDSPVLSINDVSVSEGTSSTTTTLTFTVTSSLPAPTGGITFNIGTQDDTATVANNDYVAHSLTSQTIPATQTTYTFDVTVNGDILVEPNETLLVILSAASGATIGDGQGVGTITNDDAANLVISQVYGGGNNAGAPYQNDFVEIFNRGTTIVDFTVTPYSIQYAGVGNNFGSNKTNLTSGTMAPGRYFLIKESGGTTNGVALPAFDATGSIAMGNTSGKVALVAGTNALGAFACPGDDVVSPFNPSDSQIADFVGYGSTATTTGHCYEGTGPATAPSNTTADLRKAGGCTDTDQNGADFLVSGPFPRHLGSTINNCTAGPPPNLTINDVTVTEGDSGTTTATFTVSLSAPAPSTDISFDIATANNSATTANSDYVTRTLTSQVIPAGQTTYRFDVTVNGDTAVESDETFFVNVTNASGANVLDGQGIGTITNDDLPVLTINDVTLFEGNSSTKLFTFTVSLSAPALAGGVTFDIATQNNTATVANNDYVNRSLTGQTITAGNSTYSFDVTVNGDTNIETDETFFVNVTNMRGATLTGGDGQGLGTIQNDDSSSTDLSITKTTPSVLVVPGNNINYTITATNNGPGTAANAAVADTVPANTTFQSITPPAGWSCITPIPGGTGSITCLRPSFAASTSAIFPLSVNVNAGATPGTSINNTAQITSDATDTNNANDSATATVNVVAAASADLSITKLDSPDLVAIGNDLTYSIALTNNGPASAASAQFGDTLPANTTFRSLTVPASWSCITPAVGGTGSINCSTPSLSVSATATFQLVVRVSPAVSDGTILTNTVNASSSTPDSISSNSTATATTTVKAPLLVISQVYGGGGNGSATYTHDFIEIFNRGTTTVDFSVTPYSLQYAGATGNFGLANTRTDIANGTIAPGRYFLVEEASGGAVGAPLPTPDLAGGVIAMSATAGKVALVLGTTALSGVNCPGDDGLSPFNPGVAAIMDFLGYGSTANCYEGAGPPTVSGTNSNARSVIRTASCTDTNVNSADFSNPTTPPTARNSATAAVSCP